jgi:hypothetical protein
VQHQNQLVVKALFMSTPKKETARTPVPAKTKEAVSEACSRLRKLNLACREVPSRYMLLNSKTAKKIEEAAVSRTAKKVEETAMPKSTKKGSESRTNGKKKILGRSLKCADAEADERSRDGSDNSAADENSVAETATFNQHSNAVLQEVRIVVDTLRADNSGDNKENLVGNRKEYLDQRRKRQNVCKEKTELKEPSIRMKRMKGNETRQKTVAKHIRKVKNCQMKRIKVKRHMLIMRYVILGSQHSDANIVTHCYGMKEDWILISKREIPNSEYVTKMEKSVYQSQRNLLLISRYF